MQKLQEEIFFQTKKLTGTVNIVRIFFYTLVSSLILVFVLYMFNMLTLPLVGFIVLLSALYSFLRDYSISKYSNKQLDKFYAHAKAEHDDLNLYIPLLEKTYQGYFLKRAALIIDNNQLYMEAFRQKKKADHDQISIPVKYGDKFVIDRLTTDKNNKSVTIDSTFSGQYYRFSIINHPRALQKIEESKRGGK
jgi:glucan phosphoethanolaminetransferase (alkaline phosphatase superfamily)